MCQANLNALNEGVELLTILDDSQYRQGCKPVFASTIGAHFRHVIEHYRCLFEQIDCGDFCYDQRERDAELEIDRNYALSAISDVCRLLDNLDVAHFEKKFRIFDHLTTSPLDTTLQRELMFLHSHTVHHYAIIAGMCRGQGIQPKCNFGVAIATQLHFNEQTQKSSLSTPETTTSAKTSADGGRTCAQ